MGIRFFCPNGHSLNVKEELAGKIGFCPKCQARMVIPSESTRLSGERFHRDKQDLVETLPKNAPSNDPNASQPSEGTSGVDNNSDFRSSRLNLPVNEIIREVVDTSHYNRDGRKGRELRKKLSPSVDDRNCAWFVRTSDGQQFGPASNDVFQTWIKERRVSPLTLIWRQDWESWQEAGKVFPEIKEYFEADESNEVNSSDGSSGYRNENVVDMSSEKPDESLIRLTQRERRASNSFMVICSLIGVCLVLLGVLIFVLLR